jgi:hypothetical protein
VGRANDRGQDRPGLSGLAGHGHHGEDEEHGDAPRGHYLEDVMAVAGPVLETQAGITVGHAAMTARHGCTCALALAACWFTLATCFGQVELPLLVQIHARNPGLGRERVIPGGLLRLPGIS